MAARNSRPPRMKVRTGDHVEVISGKDRGKQGRILRVDTKAERVFVEGLNMIKRHTRPQQVAGAQSEAALGGVIEREGPIHVSNVMIVDGKGKRTRIGIERENGQRYRVARNSGTRLD